MQKGKAKSLGKKAKSGGEEDKDADFYHTVDEIYDYLTRLEKTSEFATIEDIGLTSENRSMKVFKVSYR